VAVEESVHLIWVAQRFAGLYLPLGGAAVHRCDKRIVLRVGFSRCGTTAACRARANQNGIQLPSKNSRICAQYPRTVKSVLKCPPRRNSFSLTPVTRANFTTD
jgi:hypothetical protein